MANIRSDPGQLISMDEKGALDNFVALTQVPESVARVTLERNGWDMEVSLEHGVGYMEA